MKISLQVKAERYPLRRSFTIARGTKTEAHVVTCILDDGMHAGRGECVPYARYGESVESVMQTIEGTRALLASGISRQELQTRLHAGAARNAIDCALWDLEAKASGQRAYQHACALHPRPLHTAVTISLGAPEDMAAETRALSDHALLKVKVGTGDDRARIQAVRSAAPKAAIILDANEGWSRESLRDHLIIAAHMRISLIEQPLPVGQDAILGEIPHPVPICADESVHVAADIPALVGRYDAVNIKLDKTGGLSEALEALKLARSLGFGVMIGCMVGTSLAMAPAMLLAQEADYVDLDGPLLLARDRSPGLHYSGSVVSPPVPELWG